MMFVKVKAEGEAQRGEVKRLSDIFRARIIDVTDTTYMHRADRFRRQARRLHQGPARETISSKWCAPARWASPAGEKALTL